MIGAQGACKRYKGEFIASFQIIRGEKRTRLEKKLFRDVVIDESPKTSPFLSLILYDPAKAFNFEALVIIEAITTAVIIKNCTAEISLK